MEEASRPPVAVHARDDHRAARPVLLHVMRGAIPHGVGAGVVAPDRRRAPTHLAGRSARAAAPRRCADASVAGNLRGPDPVDAVCACATASGSKSPSGSKSRQKQPIMATVTMRFIVVHPNLKIRPRTVSDWRAKVNSRKTSMRPPTTHAKYVLMWTKQKPPRSPKWKPWRMSV